MHDVVEIFLMLLYTPFFKRIPNFLPSLIILKFSDFELRIILKLFLNNTGVTSQEKVKNIFQFWFMFYYIIMLSKSLYFA